MGLEGVELMMDVEDRFEIALPDSAMEQILTVGDLHAFLMDRIRQQNSAVCLSAALFIRYVRSLSMTFLLIALRCVQQRDSNRWSLKATDKNFGANWRRRLRRGCPG